MQNVSAHIGWIQGLLICCNLLCLFMFSLSMDLISAVFDTYSGIWWDRYDALKYWRGGVVFFRWFEIETHNRDNFVQSRMLDNPFAMAASPTLFITAIQDNVLSFFSLIPPPRPPADHLKTLLWARPVIIVLVAVLAVWHFGNQKRWALDAAKWSFVFHWLKMQGPDHVGFELWDFVNIHSFYCEQSVS